MDTRDEILRRVQAHREREELARRHMRMSATERRRMIEDVRRRWPIEPRWMTWALALPRAAVSVCGVMVDFIRPGQRGDYGRSGMSGPADTRGE